MWVLAVCCGLVPPECASGGPNLRQPGAELEVNSPCVVQGHHLSHKAEDLVLAELFLLRLLCEGFGFNRSGEAPKGQQISAVIQHLLVTFEHLSQFAKKLKIFFRLRRIWGFVL